MRKMNLRKQFLENQEILVIDIAHIATQKIQVVRIYINQIMIMMLNLKTWLFLDLLIHLIQQAKMIFQDNSKLPKVLLFQVKIDQEAKRILMVGSNHKILGDQKTLQIMHQ